MNPTQNSRGYYHGSDYLTYTLEQIMRKQALSYVVMKAQAGLIVAGVNCFMAPSILVRSPEFFYQIVHHISKAKEALDIINSRDEAALSSAKARDLIKEGMEYLAYKNIVSGGAQNKSL
jgi:hypothetical protein